MISLNSLAKKTNQNILLESTSKETIYTFEDMYKVIDYLNNELSKNIFIITSTDPDSYFLSICALFSKKNITLLSSSLGDLAIKSIIRESDLTLTNENHINTENNVVQSKYYIGQALVKNKHYSNDIKIELNSKLIFLSSGSTGTPKKIPVCLDQVEKCFTSVFKMLPSGTSNLKSMYCIHDPSFVILIPYILLSLYYNIKLIVPSAKTSVLQKFSYINDVRPNILVSVPSMLEGLALAASEDVNIDILITCGEPLYISKARELIKKFSPTYFYNFYGSTELAPWAFCLNIIEYLDKIKKPISQIIPIGLPLDSCISKIINNELLISCPWIMSGYIAEDNSKCQSHLLNISEINYYRTSDRAFISNNYYYCDGRLGYEQKICGVRLNIYEVEAIVSSLDQVHQVVVIPTKNKLIVLVVSLDMNNILVVINKKLKHYLDSRINFKVSISKENLKLNKSGKIDRAFYSNISNTYL
tara:strand:+ start:616 stop:2034 length:1419 start_codon:yes stop_codon:yes gene_type:complete